MSRTNFSITACCLVVFVMCLSIVGCPRPCGRITNTYFERGPIGYTWGFEIQCEKIGLTECHPRYSGWLVVHEECVLHGLEGRKYTQIIDYYIGSLGVEGLRMIISGGLIGDKPKVVFFGDVPDGWGSAMPEEVPDVSDLTESEAVAALEAAGFTATVIYVAIDSVTNGNVVWQIPEAGSLTDLGSTVWLTVASYVSVPDVSDVTESEAVAAIEAAGLTATVDYEADDAEANGNVLRQSPEAGSAVDPGSTVSLTVVSRYVSVPDVSDLTESEAVAAIEAVGLTATVTYEANDDEANGNVLRQSLEVGSLIFLGSTVRLTVASRYVSVPDVSDLTESEAVAAIEAAGLLVGSITGIYSVIVKEGCALPLPDSIPELDAVVDLKISLGAPPTETIMLPGSVLPLDMVWMPAGTYLMGSESGRSNERPVHEVTLTQGFWMGKYEVTKAQWELVMGATPWFWDGVLDDPNSSACYVSWNDVQEFITALNEQTGESFRLPTEAEWEYACRAGTSTAYSFGDDSGNLSDYAWWNGNAEDVGEDYAHVVGQLLPNPWGLYDMHGNAWEWCQDDWHDSYRDAPGDGSSWGDGSSRVLRGGSWGHPDSNCRCASRFGTPPGGRSNGLIGFRVARTP